MFPGGRVDTAQAAKIAQVSPATVRKWLERGKITRNPDGICLESLMIWIDRTRDPDRALRGKIAAHRRYQARHFGLGDAPKINVPLR